MGLTVTVSSIFGTQIRIQSENRSKRIKRVPIARIEIQSVTKTYDDGSRGVDDISLEVHDGEALVLLGPSGCGKSTTLRLIAGLETVTSGNIRLGDRDITNVKPRDRDLAMVFQSYALYPHLDVEENIGFALRMRGMPRDQRRQRARSAAERLGLLDVMNKRPGQLSGGQRQRVALGRAIVREPSAFLLDEPLSNLDPQRRASTRLEIRRLQRELGVTTVYVTHDHEEAMALGDRIVIMNEGRIAQIGTPDEVYHAPASAFVGAFLGSPKMNLLDAKLERDEQGVRAVVSDELTIELDPTRVDDAISSGDPVTIGIRPDDLGTSADGPIRGIIEDIESVGFARDVIVNTDGMLLRARIGTEDPVSIGEPIQIGAARTSIHTFGL